MHYKFIITITALMVIFIDRSFSQALLTPGQAVALALRNNFIVQAEKNNAAIADIGNTAGNAGMLPQVQGSIAGSASVLDNNSKFQPVTSAVQEYRNDTATALNPAVTLTWTLFDGMKMFAERSRLKRLKEIGDLDYKDTLQTVAAQTITAYYDIVSAQQQLAGVEKAISLSQERVKITEKQFQVGTVSKVDYLQAQVDLNEQKSSLLAEEDIIIQKKITLNGLLARPPETDFLTIDSIPVNYAPPRSGWADVQAENFEIIAGLKNVEVARLERRKTLSQFMPTLAFSGGYSLDNEQYSTGSTLLDKTWGWSAGLALSVPLFNGFNNVHALSIADLNIANSQISLDNTRLLVRQKYYQAQKDFEKALESLKLEEENIGLADENVKIALERFRLAESTSIEMRTAEVSYVDALTRLVTARFNAKAAETELMRIQGELVK
jgi:outer membrane protein TolC